MNVAQGHTVLHANAVLTAIQVHLHSDRGFGTAAKSRAS
jgi:hypothetical protein